LLGALEKVLSHEPTGRERSLGEAIGKTACEIAGKSAGRIACKSACNFSKRLKKHAAKLTKLTVLTKLAVLK
jgi:hypothetical protein